MLMSMEPQAIRAFLAVAESGSFTQAARRVLRTQPAVSMAVHSLEQEFGRELFHRSPQGIRLTEAGERLREMVGPLLREWDAAAQRLEESLTGEVTGRLTVGAGEAILLHWLPAVVQRFRKRFPGVAVVLRHQTRAQSVRELRSGDIDLAVRSTAGLDKDLDVRLLLSSERCIIAPRGTGLPRKPRVTHLAAHPFVLPREGAFSRRAVEGLFEREGLTLRVALESGGWALLKAHVAAGFGIAVVPDLALTPADHRHLEVRRPGGMFGEDRFGVLLDPRRPPRRAAAAFADLCVAHAR